MTDPGLLSSGPGRARPALGRYQPLLTFATAVVVVACLYWARPVLMPVALAVLITFLLAPATDALRRLGLGRALSACLVVVLALALVLAIGWVIGVQVVGLAHELPKYVDNIKRKVADVRAYGRGSALEKLQETAKEVSQEINKEETAGKPPEEKPVPVVVENSTPAPFNLPLSTAAVLEALASAGLVVVLVLFMLLRRAELRNRVIRLLGHGRLTVATKALDEAGRRITRYLLVQAIVNGSFGAAIGLGLFLIGLPYPVVWGLLAAIIRYVPYVGPWIAALLPIGLSLAVFEGWTQPLLVVGLFVVIELVSNNLMEPMLYGHTAGVSEVALLVAVAFWTWLWGPVGLILATPMTVCLVVFSRYVPRLEFIVVLMADEPVLEADVRYYQRLLAADQDEASEVVEQFLRDHPADGVYDQILVPALVAAGRDAARGDVTLEEQRFILQATRDIVDGLPEPTREDGDGHAVARPVPARPVATVVGCPARDEADALALVMLGRLLAPRRVAIEILPPGLLVAETAAAVAARDARVVCVASLATHGLARTRHLCERLRREPRAQPALSIVVGRWGPEDEDGARARLQAVGADEVASTLVETRDQLLRTIQLLGTLTPPAATPQEGRAARIGTPVA
jgi:predicted PurR-regulated permease PerM